MWTSPEIPRNDLPPLPPPGEIETVPVLKAVIEARTALARLDESCSQLPDPSMLINIVPLLEAQASSEIENIVTTNDELFRAAHDALSQPQTPAVKEALQYREALRVGSDAIKKRPLGINTAMDVCSTIRGLQAFIRNTPGTFIGNPVTKERIYTPPEGAEVIQHHLDLWEKFLHTDHHLDPLIVMALQHYQFEAIHPFTDGNGRTGRILNMLSLIEGGLLRSPVLYLSGYIVRNKSEYYARLRGVTQRDQWDDWLLFMINACRITANWTLDLVNAIRSLQEVTEQRIHKLIPRAPAAEFARLLFRQPYIRIENITESGYAQRQTAAQWLNLLAVEDVVTVEKIGRSKVFINEPLTELLFSAPLAWDEG